MGGFRCVFGCFWVCSGFGGVSWPFLGVGGGWVACCSALVGGVGGAVVVSFGVQSFGGVGGVWCIECRAVCEVPEGKKWRSKWRVLWIN